MTELSNDLSAADRALAAWETTTVQNLNPLLSETDAAALWAAILAQRQDGDAETFAQSVREIAATVDAPVRDRIEAAIRSLIALTAPTQE